MIHCNNIEKSFIELMTEKKTVNIKATGSITGIHKYMDGTQDLTIKMAVTNCITLSFSYYLMTINIILNPNGTGLIRSPSYNTDFTHPIIKWLCNPTSFDQLTIDGFSKEIVRNPNSILIILKNDTEKLELLFSLISNKIAVRIKNQKTNILFQVQ